MTHNALPGGLFGYQKKVESGSHVDCLGLVWILGMFNLALELLLDYRSTMMIWVFWSPSFPQISSRFICWSCGWWRRTDLFWTLRSGFHPIRFQVLRHDGGFLLFHFIHHPATYLSSFVSFDISTKPFEFLATIPRHFWLHFQHHLHIETAERWWISTGGLYHDLSDSKEGLIVAHDSVLIYPLDNAMGLPNSGGSVRSRGRGAVDHGRCPCLFPKGCMNMSGQSALVEVHDALAWHRSIFLGPFLNHCTLMMSNLVWDGLLLLTRGKFKMNPEIAGLHLPNLHFWTPFHGLLGASVEETH